METHFQSYLEKWFPSYVRLGFCTRSSRLLREFQQLVTINAESFLGCVPLSASSPKWGKKKKKKKLAPKELLDIPSKHILKWERTFI
jgi:hypothetical protein